DDADGWPWWLVHQCSDVEAKHWSRTTSGTQKIHQCHPPMDDWYSIIAAESDLPPDAARQLRDIGFVVMPGPEIPGGWARLSQAYDRAVLTADPSDVSIRSSTRVHDFVNRGPEFDGIYVFRPVLAACCRIIGRPFKLSTMLARTLEPGAPAQPLHVDVRREA